MSKKRNRHLSQSSAIERSTNTLQTKSKPIFGVTTTKSFYVPNKSFMTIDERKVDLSDHKRQRLFNKNVSFFRDITGPDDPGMLHFMSSLRKHKTLQHNTERTTRMEPFSCSNKMTMNQTFRKRIFQSTGKHNRVTSAFYRWHNTSGSQTKSSLNFECSLREYNLGMNPEQEKFDNVIKPIRYKDIQQKQYQQKDIHCPKQRRLFRLKLK